MAREGFLSSLTLGKERWMPGEEKKATCSCSEPLAGHTSARGIDAPELQGEAAGHVAPHRGCTCGLYAFYDKRSYEEGGGWFSGRDGHVAGVVSAWGEKVILCEYGFRAQYMKLEALVLDEVVGNGLDSSGSVREAHEELAWLYGVPLLFPAQVEAFSRDRGVVIKSRSRYKGVALLEAIREWREIEHRRYEHRPGSQGGESRAPAPAHEEGETRSARQA